MRNETEPVWLIDPKVSRPGYWLTYGMGILQVFGAGALFLHMTSFPEAALGAILVLSAGLFIAVARVLGARKGGATWHPTSGDVRLFGVDMEDAVRISARDIAGLHVRRRKEYWGRTPDPVLVSTVELETRTGPSLYLLEFPTLEDAEEAALTYRHATGIQLLQEDPGGGPAGALAPRVDRIPGVTVERQGLETRLQVRTGARYALSLTTLMLAAFSLVTGTLMLLAVETAGVVGFLFGPFLGALGACCLALWLFKAFGHEQLTVSPQGLQHSFHLGRLAWGRRTFALTQEPLHPRLRSRGALGFSLELLVDDRVFSIGSGATRRSPLAPASLVQLGVFLRGLAQPRE